PAHREACAHVLRLTLQNLAIRRQRVLIFASLFRKPSALPSVLERKRLLGNRFQACKLALRFVQVLVALFPPILDRRLPPLVELARDRCSERPEQDTGGA